MKNKAIITTFAFFGLVGGYLLTTQMEVDYTNPVLAVDDTATPIDVSCADVTNVAYAPGKITYAITPSNAGEDIGPSAAATMTLSLGDAGSNGVDGQNNAMANPLTAVESTGTYVGKLFLDSEGPNAKVAGLQCDPNVDKSTLEIFGDGADNALLDVAFSDKDDNSNSTFANDKADAKLTGDPLQVFGSNATMTGTVQAASVADATDRAGLHDGEITFGGVGADTTGSYGIGAMVDWTNSDVAVGTHTETVTYRFSLSN